MTMDPHAYGRCGLWFAVYKDLIVIWSASALLRTTFTVVIFTMMFTGGESPSR